MQITALEKFWVKYIMNDNTHILYRKRWIYCTCTLAMIYCNAKAQLFYSELGKIYFVLQTYFQLTTSIQNLTMQLPFSSYLFRSFTFLLRYVICLPCLYSLFKKIYTFSLWNKKCIEITEPIEQYSCIRKNIEENRITV